MLLFCFLFEDTCKDAAKKNPNCIGNHPEKRHLHRCAVIGMFDSAEHIAVVVRHGDAHEVGEDEGEYCEKVLQFFHGLLLSHISGISLITTLSSDAVIKKG